MEVFCSERQDRKEDVREKAAAASRTCDRRVLEKLGSDETEMREERVNGGKGAKQPGSARPSSAVGGLGLGDWVGAVLVTGRARTV